VATSYDEGVERARDGIERRVGLDALERMRAAYLS